MPSLAKRFVKACVAGFVCVLVGVVVSACELDHSPDTLRDAYTHNRSRTVDNLFEDKPVTIADPTGIDTSSKLFANSMSAIVSDSQDASLLRAASLAVFTHSPMLVYTPQNRSRIVEELHRMQARRILLVGEVDIAASSGVPRIMRDPMTHEALGKLTAHEFSTTIVTSRETMVDHVAALDGSTPVELIAAWEKITPDEGKFVSALPVQTRRDGLNAPITVGTKSTSIAAIANARAYGADVDVLLEPDPSKSSETMQVMAGLSDRPLLALGPDFPSGNELSLRIARAEKSVGLRTSP